MTNSRRSAAVVFGGADGLTLILGLVLGLVVSHQPGLSVWHAALSGGVAEFGGMALAQYWSDPARDKAAALCNGTAAAVTVILPGVPFLVASGTYAVVLSVMTIFLFGLALTWLREERGLLAVGHTFGLLLLAASLSAGANLIPIH